MPALAVVVDWCVVMGGDDGNMCTIRQVKNHLKRALFNTVTCSKATASCNVVVLHITPITPLLFVEHRYAVLTHTLRRLYVAVVVFSAKKNQRRSKEGSWLRHYYAISMLSPPELWSYEQLSPSTWSSLHNKAAGQVTFLVKFNIFNWCNALT